MRCVSRWRDATIRLRACARPRAIAGSAYLTCEKVNSRHSTPRKLTALGPVEVVERQTRSSSALPIPERGHLRSAPGGDDSAVHYHTVDIDGIDLFYRETTRFSLPTARVRTCTNCPRPSCTCSTPDTSCWKTEGAEIAQLMLDFLDRKLPRR